jgi:D-3-phosphoglycerate dehydrogenase / 2-oxoglutarate reductase
VKILIADPFEPGGLQALAAAGSDVLYEPDLTGDRLIERIRTSAAKVLIVRGTRVPAAAFETGALGLVVRAGAGFNTIDVASASRHGIYVSNCPGKNAVAVAELTFALILAIDRHIPENVADLRAGRWNKKAYSKARGLAGRTLGLIGLGHIGCEVARRAQAFGMQVVGWSRRFNDVGGLTDECGVPIRLSPTPQQLAAEADILSVHLALTPETRHFVNASILGGLKPGGYFINTARAEVVDSAALAAAVRDGGIKAGLDVFDDEPVEGAGAFTNPLTGLPGVYGTHHIGASTDQAQEAIAAEAVRIVLAYQMTGRVATAVNLATRTRATRTLVVRHHDRPGVLAHVFEHLRAAGVNVQETENIIFDGGEAAVARINLDAEPDEAVLAAIRTGNRDIIELDLLTV